MVTCSGLHPKIANSVHRFSSMIPHPSALHYSWLAYVYSTYSKVGICRYIDGKRYPVKSSVFSDYFATRWGRNRCRTSRLKVSSAFGKTLDGARHGPAKFRPHSFPPCRAFGSLGDSIATVLFIPSPCLEPCLWSAYVQKWWKLLILGAGLSFPSWAFEAAICDDYLFDHELYWPEEDELWSWRHNRELFADSNKHFFRPWVASFWTIPRSKSIGITMLRLVGLFALLLIMVGASIGRDMKAVLFAPLTGERAVPTSTANQWIELSASLAANITDEWNTGDTFSITVWDTQSSRYRGFQGAELVADDSDMVVAILIGLSPDELYDLARFLRLADVRYDIQHPQKRHPRTGMFVAWLQDQNTSWRLSGWRYVFVRIMCFFLTNLNFYCLFGVTKIPCIAPSRVSQQDPEQHNSNFFSIHPLFENVPEILSAFRNEFEWDDIALLVDEPKSGCTCAIVFTWAAFFSKHRTNHHGIWIQYWILVSGMVPVWNPSWRLLPIWNLSSPISTPVAILSWLRLSKTSPWRRRF